MRAPILTFKRARRLRREMTLPEVLLWRELKNGGVSGAHFRKQHPVGPFILDFFCAAATLAIEIDGAVHGIAEQALKDGQRDRWLTDRGIHVLRFVAPDILDARLRQDVLATIAAVLAERR